MTIPHTNDTRAPRHLNVGDPYELEGVIVVALLVSFLIPFAAHTLFQPSPGMLGVLIVLVVLLAIYHVWVAYTGNRDAQDQDAPDAFYQQLAEYLESYPEHRAHVEALTQNGLLTLRQAKCLAETLNGLQKKLQYYPRGKDLFLRTVSKRPTPDSPVAARPSA